MLKCAVTKRFGTVRWIIGALAALLIAPSTSNAQVTFSVGTGGTHPTIQDAVNACPVTGCVINLNDSVYKLLREVWIENKSNLTIQASPALSLAKIRPRLYYAAVANEFDVAGTAVNPADPDRPKGWKRWPISNTTAVGGAKNLTNQYSTSGFQNNGNVVVYKSTNVTIDGIMIDGVKAKTFVNKGIWSGMYDVFFGNVGINLFESKNVKVVNTDVRNCFSAIYIQNRNVGGAFAAPNPDDLDVKTIIPYSQFGKMGNHLIEKNYFHHNWYVFYDEMEWDIGSTIRYNICDQNYNQQFAQNTDSSAESNNMTGGFMYLKDVTIVPHKIYNNTINGSSIVFGHGYFKPGVQHYFYNNLVTGWNRAGKNASMIGNDRQMLKWYKNFLYNNTFEVGAADSFYQIQKQTSGQINDSARCALKTQTAPCWLDHDPVNAYFGIKNQWLWNGWNVLQGSAYTAVIDTSSYQIYNNQNIDTFHVGGIISKLQGLGTAVPTANNATAQANYWAKTVPYLSKDSTRANYMEPRWTDSIVMKTILDKGWTAAGNRDADGSMPDRGAVPASKGALISPMTLKDQSIVYLNPGKRTVSFDYCLEGSGNWSDIRLETVEYYNNIARSTDKAEKPAPDWPAPQKLTNTGAAPELGRCRKFEATLPVAPVDSFARFDLVFSGTLDGKTVRSNVGVWIWRKTQYVLDVYFTKHGGAATDTVTSIRVGEPVDMRVKALRTDGTAVTLPIDVLTASPDVVTLLVTGDKVIAQGDTVSKNVPAAGTTIPIYFTSTGSASIAMSGTIGTLPVPGGASIMVRPGLPEKVEWQNPPSYKFIDRTLTLDSAAAVIPQAPTAVKLQVKDKWGNNVDTIGVISIKGLLLDPLVTDLAFAATASGPFTGGPNGPWTLKSDMTGAVNISILAKGVQGQKFWGVANVSGKTILDSALMKLGTQLERLYFVPVVPIDTFVTIRRQVHLILSENGTTPKTTSAWSTANVQLRSKLGTKFYASATSTVPLDSVALTASEVDLWVTSDIPVLSDTLQGFNPFLGQGLPAVYAPVSFRMPPVPPSPVPDTASFLDLNCDGKADVARLWLKATTTSAAALDTTLVKPELIVVKYADGTADSIGPTGWSTVGGSFAVIDLKLAKAPAITNPMGTLAMKVRLRRPPVNDTTIWVGTTIPVADRIGPRPVAGAIVENFSPGVIADTVRVAFSEPVTFTGTNWPFVTREVPAGTIVDASGITVAPMSGSASKSLTFIISGNAAGTIHAGQSIAIDSGSLLVDASANHGKSGECLSDTAILSLVTQPVPMVSSWMKDADGDGSADRLTIVFRRALRPVDHPDNFSVAWGTTKTVDLSLATTTDSITWTITFATPFPKGVTQGTYPGGVGQLTLTDGVGAIARVETIAIIDSVAPIPMSAGLRYGIGGASDTLYVTYSEPMKTVTGTSWMLDQRLADAPISTTSGIPSGIDGLKMAFLVNAADANYPRPGDSIRLPAGAASNLADAHGILPSTPTSPYVEVAAPPIPMVRSAITDANGDGAADRATVVFLRRLRPVDMADSLVLAWGTETRAVRFAGATTTDSTTWTFPIAIPFTKGVTAGAATDGSGSVTLRKGSALSGRTETIALADSVAPIPTSASLRYGASGIQDTLVVTYSEPLVRKAGTAWMLDQQASDAAVSILSGTAAAGDATWSLLIDATAAVYPHPGDSVRLPSGAASNFADARGILPTTPTSPYVVVVGPPIPMVSTFLRDSDGDGRADQVSVKFLKRLRAIDIPDSLLLSWGIESRSVRVAGSTTTDSTTWLVSLAVPFEKGVTTGTGINGTGTVTLLKSLGAQSRREEISMADSVAPIPTTAQLRYGPAGGMDTLVVHYSEILKSRVGTSWMLNQKGGDASIGIVSGSVSLTDPSSWNLIVDPNSSVRVQLGDSIRLPSSTASSLADAYGVLPTTPKSPYVMVMGGDRPPVSAWYLDKDGDGRVDHAVLVFSEALTTNPTYVLNWGAETREADASDYGGVAIGKSRLEIALKTPFAFGATASTISSGTQTSAMVGSTPSISNFPIDDSVPPVILTARVGYTSYSEPGSKDTLFLKLSEPVKLGGNLPVLGRGEDGKAYPIGAGKSVAEVVQISADSLLFLCDTSCVDGPSSAGMPDNGDSVRLIMPMGDVFVTDNLGNAPGVEAKWTLVRAGDRPYLYNVNIFPHGVLVEGKDFVPNREIKSKDPLSTWILKDGKWLEFKNGQLTGQSYLAGPDGEIERNGVGLKVDINGAFDATLMLYDNMGTFVGNAVVVIDSAMAKALGNSAGKFSVYFMFNGRYGSPDKIAGSGVYLIRYLTFRSELQLNGTRQRRVLENKVYKVGRKGSEQ